MLDRVPEAESGRWTCRSARSRPPPRAGGWWRTRKASPRCRTGAVVKVIDGRPWSCSRRRPGAPIAPGPRRFGDRRADRRRPRLWGGEGADAAPRSVAEGGSRRETAGRGDRCRCRRLLSRRVSAMPLKFPRRRCPRRSLRPGPAGRTSTRFVQFPLRNRARLDLHKSRDEHDLPEAQPRLERLNPNDPGERVTVVANSVTLSFILNPWAYEAEDGERASLTFLGCKKWRLGRTNDEGWYRGQCRYSGIAPESG